MPGTANFSNALGPKILACVALASFTLLFGCRSNPVPVKSPPISATPSLHQGPLTDYVPAAGLRWMVVGNPRSFAANPEFLKGFRAADP